MRGVAGADRLGGLGDLADEAGADPEPRAVHRVGVEAFGRGELELVVAAEIDRADLRDQAVGDQADDAVEPFLAAAGLRERGAQAGQQDAAVNCLENGMA